MLLTIKSGFKTTGIYPCNAPEVYKKLHNERYKAKVHNDINDALLNFLKDPRSLDKDKSIKRGKKKMINIEPGT